MGQDRPDRKLDRAIRRGVKEARRLRDKAAASTAAVEAQIQKLGEAQAVTEQMLQQFLASRTNGHNGGAN